MLPRYYTRRAVVGRCGALELRYSYYSGRSIPLRALLYVRCTVYDRAVSCSIYSGLGVFLATCTYSSVHVHGIRSIRVKVYCTYCIIGGLRRCCCCAPEYSSSGTLTYSILCLSIPSRSNRRASGCFAAVWSSGEGVIIPGRVHKHTASSSADQMQMLFYILLRKLSSLHFKVGNARPASFAILRSRVMRTEHLLVLSYEYTIVPVRLCCRYRISLRALAGVT